MTIVDEIRKDFDELEDVLLNKFEAQTCLKDKNFNQKSLTEYHRNLIFLKDIYNSLKDIEILEKPIQSVLIDCIDFIWMVYIGRYKSAISSLRNGLDLAARVLVRMFDSSVETNSFTNNMELAIKKIRTDNEAVIQGIREKKAHKSFLNINFKEEMVKVYGELSDFVHGKETGTLEIAKYIEESLDYKSNQNAALFNYCTEIANKGISLVLALTMLLNYKELAANMNTYKFNLISEFQIKEYKQYKAEYLT